MPLNARARAHLDQQAGKVPLHALAVAAARRREAEEAEENPPPADEVALVDDRAVEGPAGSIPVRVYHPDPQRRLPIVVHLHGGGWVLGSIALHDGICRRLANASGCVVVSVEYRLAPEHPFPAGLDDACAATRWVGANPEEVGGAPGPVALCGTSAGGNLAAVVALRMRDALRAAGPQPSRESGEPSGTSLAFQVLVYPVTAHEPATASMVECAQGYGLEAADMRWYWDHYVPPGVDRRHPGLSPLLAADLSGLPAALVLTAEYDPLRDEGEAYAERLRAAGVPVTCRRYPGTIHGFVDELGSFEEADEAVREIAAALRGAFGTG